MKTKKIRIRQGFTIVELVIVIGVIGVLSAVLIPTFINLNNKANQAADESLIKNLNTQLRIKETSEGKNATMTEALADALEAGYKVENLTPKSGKDIVWDQEKDEFAQKESAPTDGTAYKFWTIAKSAGDLTKGYSSYLYFQPTSDITVSTGFDVGEYSGVNVSYVRPGNPATDPEHNVIVRTDGGTFTVDGPADIVKHYGFVDKIWVKHIKGSSYHEYGRVRVNMQIDDGHVVVEDEGYVEELSVPETAEGNSVSVNVTNGGTVNTAVVDDTEATVEVASAGTVGQYIGDTTQVSGAGAEKVESIEKTLVGTEEELDEAIGESKPYIAFKNDITATTVKILGYNVTIDGAGHKLTSSANRIFRVQNSKTEFLFKDLDMVSTYAGSDSRVISVDSGHDTMGLKINGCSMKCGYYALNVTGVNGSGTRNLTINVTDSTIEGYAAINNHASSAFITVNNSTLIGNNDKSASSGNSFATIVFDGSNYESAGSTNYGSKIVVSNSTLKQITTTTNYEVAFSSQYGNIASEAWFNNINLVHEGENAQYFNYAYSKDNNVKIYIDGELYYEGY